MGVATIPRRDRRSGSGPREPWDGRSSPSRYRGRPINPHITLFVAFGWISLVNYAFSLLASRILGPGDFGLLAFTQALLLLGGTILQSGIPWSLAKQLRAPAAGRGPVVRGALLANIGVGLAMSAGIGALYVLGPLRAGLEDPAIGLLIMVVLPLFAVIAVARAVAQGTARFGTMASLQVVEVTTKAVTGLGLAAAGLGALGAVLGFGIGAVAATLLGAAVIVAAGVRPVGRAEIPVVRDVGPMFGTLLGLALMLNLDLLAVKLLVEDRGVTGHYQAAIILANAPYFLVTSALIPVLFTRLAHHADLGATKGRTAQTLQLTVALALPVEAMLVLAPEPILALLFPATYAPAAGFLRVMAVGNAALMVLATFSAAFQAVGRAIVPARIILSVVAVEAALLVALVPSRGASAAVGTFAAAASVAATAVALAYLRAADVAVRASVPWVARLLGAVAVGVTSWLLAQQVATAIVALAVGGLAYGLAAIALRVIESPRLRLGRPVA